MHIHIKDLQDLVTHLEKIILDYLYIFHYDLCLALYIKSLIKIFFYTMK